MKKLYFLLISIISLSVSQSFAQEREQGLPHIMTDAERLNLPEYNALRDQERQMQTGFTTPPSSPVRTIGEWEELQGFTITWTSFTTMLTQIVKYAKLET